MQRKHFLASEGIVLHKPQNSSYKCSQLCRLHTTENHRKLFSLMLFDYLKTLFNISFPSILARYA